MFLGKVFINILGNIFDPQFAVDTMFQKPVILMEHLKEHKTVGKHMLAFTRNCRVAISLVAYLEQLNCNVCPSLFSSKNPRNLTARRYFMPKDEAQ